MKYPEIIQKISAVVLGIVMGLAVVESGLQIAGAVAKSRHEARSARAAAQQASYRILCLGDSMTAGGDSSYPAQLERILNDARRGPRFSVINEGVPGNSSSAVTARAEKLVEKYHPDLVVVMMGINDNFLFNIWQKPSDGVIKKIVKSLKTYKLMRLIWLHIQSRLQAPTRAESSEPEQRPPSLALEKTQVASQNLQAEVMNLIKAGEFISARDILLKLKSKNPDDEGLDFYLGLCSVRLKEYESAQGYFQDLLKANPNATVAYSYLAFIAIETGKNQEAVELLGQGLKLNPYNAWAYYLLVEAQRALGNSNGMREACQRAIANVQDKGWFENVLAKLNENGRPQGIVPAAGGKNLDYSSPLLEANYHKLVHLAKKKDMRLVCVQYPMRALEPLQELVGAKGEVVFVDNEQVFKSAVSAGTYEDYFVDFFGGNFGHCTSRGYTLLAENIARVILKEVFGGR